MAFDREFAGVTIYCEASGEPHEGKIGVAASLFNRLHTGRYGKTVAEICLAPYQYSEWNKDRPDWANLQRALRLPETDPVMMDCLEAYDAAMAGEDPTQGATHYYAVSIPPPAWAAQGVFTVQLGHHRFYRNVP